MQFYFIAFHIKIYLDIKWKQLVDLYSTSIILLVPICFRFYSIGCERENKLYHRDKMTSYMVKLSHKVENVLNRWLVACILCSVYLSSNYTLKMSVTRTIVIHILIQRHSYTKQKQKKGGKEEEENSCLALFELCRFHFVSEFCFFYIFTVPFKWQTVKIIKLFRHLRPSFRSTCSVILWKIWRFRFVSDYGPKLDTN